MSFIIKKIVNSMHRQTQREKNNTPKKIKKYDELCQFVVKLSESDKKGKNCLI